MLSKQIQGPTTRVRVNRGLGSVGLFLGDLGPTTRVRVNRGRVQIVN